MSPVAAPMYTGAAAFTTAAARPSSVVSAVLLSVASPRAIDVLIASEPGGKETEASAISDVLLATTF